MYCFVTQEMIDKQKLQDMAQFARWTEEAQRKQEAKDAWELSHPKCPHCGHKDPLPFWLTV